MKIAEREEFLAQGEYESIILSGPNIGDPIRLGVTKAPEGFRDVLKNIHSSSPGSTFDI